jgi:two-component sensor histidine kinase
MGNARIGTAFLGDAAALCRRTALLEAQINASLDGILIVDSEGRKIIQNQRVVELWKIPKAIADQEDDREQVRCVMRMTKHPEEFVEKIAFLYGHPSEISRDEIELTDGTVLDRYSAPVLGEDGESYGRIWTFRDITDRKCAERKIENLLKEKELLLKEVHHRVKNNMNTIASLLSIQANLQGDPGIAGILQDAVGRVESMEILYDKLYRSENIRAMSIKAYFQSLIGEIVGTFPGKDLVKVETRIEDFILDAKTLYALGIIVNELITNAMKYAFTGRSGGVLRVEASTREDRATVVIEDDGIGIAESARSGASGGFGLKLVEMMAEQIGGSLSSEAGRGAKFVLGFPLGPRADL